MRKLRVLDLFSGIGGFSLGLERTGGFETVAFCEIEDYPRRVLAKHWPKVPCYHDVRTLTADTLARDGIAVDVICGGFPCQDISTAGKGAGIAGERSGLWREYARLIGEIRPQFVLVENVAALLGRGLGDVLGDMAEIGYDAEWHCIPASSVGAPHRRDRVWIIAHANCTRSQGRNSEVMRQRSGEWTARTSSPFMADAAGERCGEAWGLRRDEPAEWFSRRCETLADPERFGQSTAGNCFLNRQTFAAWQANKFEDGCEGLADTKGVGRSERDKNRRRRSARARTKDVRSGPSDGGWWLVEPDVGRVANGVPARVDRLKGLGNAVVPQIPQLIGQAILDSLREAA